MKKENKPLKLTRKKLTLIDLLDEMTNHNESGWKPIEEYERHAVEAGFVGRTVLTAHVGDLVPVAAFLLIGYDGEETYLRQTEGSPGYELEDGGLKMYAVTGAFSPLLRKPTHFMEIMDMPLMKVG